MNFAVQHFFRLGGMFYCSDDFSLTAEASVVLTNQLRAPMPLTVLVEYSTVWMVIFERAC